ncbi:hypothetical protein NDU88_007342 [Pleurodeles waltl]|uniref:Reverse transcriptase domain-containing protein n=1 Tax=Pleurodeles waltl TaxID=8319 RepID=A0AAV7RP69_PLEWA|nr:hypothetical protein NDU88_007342 [Pleurodeles waltl]
MSIDEYRRLSRPPPPLRPTRVQVFAFGNTQPLEIAGVFSTEVAHDDTSRATKIYVSKEGSGFLFAAQDLNLVHFAFGIHVSALKVLVEEFSSLFEGIGCLKGPPLQLRIDESVAPVALSHRRVALRPKVEQELQLLERAGIIEKLSGPTPWVSLIVVARKPKQPEAVRICVDMCLPNQATKRERHLTPTIDDILSELSGSRWFSKMDLRSRYHQIVLHPDSRPITTFSTHTSLWRYTRLNFGISRAAEVFQHTTNGSCKGSRQSSM